MKPLSVEIIVNDSVENVWDAYTLPEHIVKWAFADARWHAPRAENALRASGRFLIRMEARDGSEGFDFSGTYDEVVPRQRIAYTMDDGRKAVVVFEEMGNSTYIKTIFDPENENPIEVQRAGWQAILDNFKTYVERM